MTTRQHAPSAARELLTALGRALVPTCLLGRRLDVLAQNRLSAALLTVFAARPPAERNHARFVFTDPHARELFPDWDAAAAATVALLHQDAQRHPHHPALAELVGDLSIRSAEFAGQWARPRPRPRPVQTLCHPLVGELTVICQVLCGAGGFLLVQTAEAGSPSEAALALLAQLVA
ncbi:MmyB family transcriptional regulator [Amycolatopsis thermoflava]|uniref:MmyB family transcriptional regulator n=1 Tax=Amycolatopsis thermoflava TaxID=84480 RepID=UPI00381B16D6